MGLFQHILNLKQYFWSNKSLAATITKGFMLGALAAALFVGVFIGTASLAAFFIPAAVGAHLPTVLKATLTLGAIAGVTKATFDGIAFAKKQNTLIEECDFVEPFYKHSKATLEVVIEHEKNQVNQQKTQKRAMKSLQNKSELTSEK